MKYLIIGDSRKKCPYPNAYAGIGIIGLNYNIMGKPYDPWRLERSGQYSKYDSKYDNLFYNSRGAPIEHWRIVSDEVAEELDAINQQIEDLRLKRNKILHDNYWKFDRLTFVKYQEITEGVKKEGSA